MNKGIKGLPGPVPSLDYLPVNDRCLSGNWIAGTAPGQAATTQTYGGGSPSLDTGTVIYLRKETAFKAIGIRVTASAVGTVARLGLYADDGDHFPGQLFRGFGTVATDATGARTIAADFVLPPGVWWPVMQWEGASNVTFAGYSNALWSTDWTTFPTLSNPFPYGGYRPASGIAVGSLPSRFNPLADRLAFAPLVALQKA